MKIDRHIWTPGRLVTAIELGAEWVKAVQVDRGGRAPRITRAEARKVEEGDTAAAALSRLLKAFDAAATGVIACVPRQAVTVRTLELPSSNPREVGDMIDLQIAKQTPYSRDEIVFDYRLSEGSRQGYTRVMLVIAPSGVMRQRFRLLEDLGLDVRLMTVSTDGLAAGPCGGDGTFALLDIDSGSSELVVLQDGMPLFSRSLPVGARDIAVDMVAGSERIIQEVTRALETFRHESPEARVDRLLLAGAVEYHAGLPDRLRAIAGMPVEVADALKGMDLPAMSSDGGERPRDVSLTAVAGVALAAERLEIDLTPGSVLTRRAMARRASDMTLTAMLVMAVLVLVSLLVESRLFARQYYLERLTALLKTTTPAADEVEAMRRKVGLVTGRMRGTLTSVALLGEIHGLVGADTSITSLEMAEGRLTIRGASTGGSEPSGKLVGTLESSPLLREVKRVRTVTVNDRTEFEITGEIGGRHP